MIVTHKINMNLDRAGVMPRVDVVQGDANTREIQFSLFSGGQAWEVPADAQVLVRYKKANGAGGTYDTMSDGAAAAVVSGNTVTVTLTPQALSADGSVSLAVTLAKGDAELSTFAVQLNVMKNPTAATDDDGNYVSVAGMIPAPETAEVGQYLEVAAVDENGKITKLTAVVAPSGGVSDEQIAAAVEEYMAENPIDVVTDEQIASAVEAYLAENPVSGGLSTPLKSALTNYFTNIQTLLTQLAYVEENNLGSAVSRIASDVVSALNNTTAGGDSGEDSGGTGDDSGGETEETSSVWLYHFDDSLASTGNHDFGLVAVDSAAYVDGKFGKALNIANNGNALYIPDMTDIPVLDGDFTIAFWAYNTQTTAYMYFNQEYKTGSLSSTYNAYTKNESVTVNAAAGNLKYAGMALFLENGSLFFRFFNKDCTKSGKYTITGHGIGTNEWHHYAISRYNGSLGLYVDGVRLVAIACEDELYVSPQIGIGTVVSETASGGNANNTRAMMIDELIINDSEALYYGESFTVPTEPYEL